MFAQKKLIRHFGSYNSIKRDRIKKILFYLSDCPKKVSQQYLADVFEVNRTTIYRDLEIFVKAKILISRRGYMATPKLKEVYHFLSDGNARRSP